MEPYCLENEIWKDIQGYEGLYQVSNLGRIRSVDGKVTYTERHGKRTWKGRILKGCYGECSYVKGYSVTLYKDGKPKDFLVHRLVLQTFNPTNDLNLTVNHIDGNRLNNNLNNLEWLTLEDNIRHAFENNLMPSVKNTKLLRLKDNKQFEFYSMSKASQFLGRGKGYISSCTKKGCNEFTDVEGNKYILLST